MSKTNKVRTSSEEAHYRRNKVLRFGADAVKNMVNSEELRLRSLPPYEGAYDDAFQEQLKASRQGKNYQLRPGLRDEAIWKAGIETPTEKELRKRLQKEASEKLKKEREATNRLIESIRATKYKGGRYRRTRRINKTKRRQQKR